MLVFFHKVINLMVADGYELVKGSLVHRYKAQCVESDNLMIMGHKAIDFSAINK